LHEPIGVGKFTVAGEAIENQRESLVALHIARSFEKFIEHRADQIL
jgi:hypothetical protein